ncbi:MAG: hypothetical protein AAFN77_18905 [Planctomycetota bacterium]
MQRWFQAFLQGRWFRGSNRRWWAGIIEAGFAAALFLAGVTLLVVNLTLSIIDRSPNDSTLYFVIYVLISITLISVGLAWIARLLWHVGVSAERRGAIAAQANELEILNELRQARDDLPTVPRDRRLPVAGQVFPFRMSPSPRNLWGLISSVLFSIIALCLCTILVLICAKSFGFGGTWVNQLEQLSERISPRKLPIPSRPWPAVALLAALIPATGWSIYHFFRQLIKLAGIGPTSIELSNYPLLPGQTYQMFISQTGRVRLQVLDVDLICQEEVTYNQGTDIRTEKAIVFEQRLLRRRGVSLESGKPFETQIELQIPQAAMHSFSSTNNRVQWKIVITAKAKNWPRLRRTFTITVHPGADPAVGKHEVAAAVS